jgi:hypothetical protein
VECIISIGYPAESGMGTPDEKLDYGRIKFNRY